MYKQVQHIVQICRRNRVVLFVLFFITGILTSVVFIDEIKRSLGTASIAFYSSIVFMILGILGFWLSLGELTRIRKISKELWQQKKLFRKTLSSISEGLITTGKKGEILYMNPAAELMTGWKFNQAKKQGLDKVYRVVNEQTGEPVDNIINRVLGNGNIVEAENNTLLKSRDAGSRVISNSGSPLLDVNGNIAGAVLIFNDISANKVIETRLKEREKQYRDLIQNLPEAVYTCDEFGFIQLYNKAAASLWGREPIPGNDQWCGSWKIFTTDGVQLPAAACTMARAVQECNAVQSEQMIIQRPDGTLRHVLSNPTPLFDADGKLTGAVNMLIDVTEKKEKEILINQTEEKYRTLVEQASDGIIVYSFDGTIYEFNKAAHDLSGYTSEEFKKLKINDLLFNEPVIINQANAEKLKAGETVLFNRKLKTKDGSALAIELSARMLPDGRNLAFVRDITAKKKAEEELRSSEERYRYLFNNNPASIFIWDAESLRILEANETAILQYGYSKEEITQKTLLDLRPQEEYSQILDFVQMAKKNSSFECSGTWQFKNQKGQDIFSSVVSHQIFYKGRNAMMAIAKNVTEKILLEKERMSRQQEITDAVLSAQEEERQEIGRELHDNINQILASSRLYLGLAKEDAVNQLEFLEETDNLINSAIREIRALSHNLIPPSVSETALMEALDDIIDRMAVTTPIVIHKNFAGFMENRISDKFKLTLYRIVQEQFNNIIKYAGAKNIQLDLLQQENEIILRIKDDGIGFDTAKCKDGVGLMNIKTRASLFDGMADIISFPGKGCELCVIFPFKQATKNLD